MTNQENRTKDFEYVRYSALVELWYHHNAMQLQWPAVIIGAALLILLYSSTIATGKDTRYIFLGTGF